MWINGNYIFKYENQSFIVFVSLTKYSEVPEGKHELYFFPRTIFSYTSTQIIFRIQTHAAVFCKQPSEFDYSSTH
jgi:hypothetical protein